MDLSAFHSEVFFRFTYLGVLLVVVTIHAITRILGSRENSPVVFTIGVLTFLNVILEIIFYLVGYHFSDGIAAARIRFAFELCVTFYIPLLVAYLPSLADLGTTWRRVNNVLTVLGLSAALVTIALAFLYPDSLVTQSPPWIDRPWNVGRGVYGPLLRFRDALLFAGILYLAVSLLVNLIRKKSVRTQWFLVVAVGVALFFAVESIYSNLTDQKFIVFQGLSFPRFLTGLLVFFLVSLARDSLRFVTKAFKADSTLKELKISQEKLVRLAFYDQLTGLPNRKNFFEKIELFILENSRTPRVMGLLFLDFDLFRIANETLGHLGGDALLKECVERLKGSLRSSDHLFRLGGDEFTLILSGLNSPTDAGLVAQKLLSLMDKPFLIETTEIHLSMSIGISVLPRDGRNALELFRKADEALTDAKRDRNTFRFFTSALNVEAVKKISIINNLRHALSQDQFELYFQPQVSASGKVTGSEALLRLKNAAESMSPGLFIPIAENSGLIQGIGNWVVRQAFQDCARLKAMGYNLPVAVNISTRQLRDVQFLGTLESAFMETALGPRDIHLEITETAFLELDPVIEHVLQRLFEKKVPLVIDDFGIGFSNLSYIRDLPISAIKIDKSFIAPIPETKRTAKLVASIIGLAKGLGMEVVAEGVENQAQLDYVCHHGADKVQGFYYAKPMPWIEFIEYLSVQGSEKR